MKRTDKDQVTESSFDLLLKAAKEDGRYQWLLIFLFMVPLSFIYSIAERNGIILLSTQDHVCHVPGRENTNYTLEEWHNLTIPWTITSKGEHKLEQCLMYQMLGNNSYSTNETTACQYGWDYDNSSWSETPVSKFDLVCEESEKVKHLFLAKFVGPAVGTLIFSILSDKFGRKPIFYTTLLINIVFGVLKVFSNSYLMFLILTFLHTLCFVVGYQAPFILVQELCNQKLRYLLTFLILTMFVLATGYNSLIAWALGDWKQFLYVTHIPSAIFLFYYKFLPESPRWLLSKGKIVECKKVMKKIAKVNGREFTDEMDDLLTKASEEEKNRKAPMKKVFTSKVLVKHLFLASVILSCTYVVAGGINMNVHMMLGNVLVNHFLLRSFEFPGNITGYVCSAYLGRKLAAILNMTLAAVCVFAASFYVSNQWAAVLLAGLCKAFCNGTIYAVYLYLSELFPTSLRASAYGIGQVIGIAAVSCVPSIVYLGKTIPQLPYWIWTGVCIFAIFFSTFLPETLDHPLPQTIKDAMEIGKNQPYCAIIHKGNVHKYLPKSEEQENVESIILIKSNVKKN